MAAWKLQEAEAACSTVFDRAFAGEPQFVMRDGEPSLVVITYAQYEASRPKARSSVLAALTSCPCDISDLIDRRESDLPSAFERSGAFQH